MNKWAALAGIEGATIAAAGSGGTTSVARQYRPVLIADRLVTSSRGVPGVLPGPFHWRKQMRSPVLFSNHLPCRARIVWSTNLLAEIYEPRHFKRGESS